MCGLSAILDFGRGDRLLKPLLDMHARIRHRGPDGEGFTIVDSEGRVASAPTAADLSYSALGALRVGLAFRWLQIQDPRKASAQPMASPDGSVWLIFNGEIYNFPEMRQQLTQLGHQFATFGDTEVLLASYLQWGTDCFARLNGMWAVVLVDLRQRKIVISRDRFGIKPLFYHRGPKRLIVASEIKQLLAAGIPAAANRAALSRFSRGLRPALPEETFFKDIFAQPAATYAEISLDRPPSELSFQPYWQLQVPAAAVITQPLEQAAATLENLLSQSVAEHLIAKAPIGHLISGGLDSSLLAALAAPIYARRGQQGMAVSMVLENSTDQYDESVYIDQVAHALKFQDFKAKFTPEWLKANIERVTLTQEEPIAGMAVAGQFLVYEAAAQHSAKVVIDGQGADEFFAGYPRHQYALLYDWVRRLDLVSLLAEATWQLWRDPRFFWDLFRLQVVPRIARMIGVKRTNVSHAFVRAEVEHEGSDPAAERLLTRAPTALSRALLTDVLSYNLKSVLAVTDRNSMAHSIEARVPYVDRKIAEFAFGLPDCYKVGRGQRKRILRMIAARYLPRSIFSRNDRIGFGTPIEQWLRDDFRGELAALTESAILNRSDLFDLAGLRTFISGFLNNRHRDTGTVWRLYAIDCWARAFTVSGL